MPHSNPAWPLRLGGGFLLLLIADLRVGGPLCPAEMDLKS